MRMAARGQYMTDANRDHTVKVVVDNLGPGEEYFYQFEVDGNQSPTGRTKTLPTCERSERGSRRAPG